MPQARGQDKIALFAESETKFFPKVIDAELEFIKDDKGVVTSLVLRQGPSEVTALKKWRMILIYWGQTKNTRL